MQTIGERLEEARKRKGVSLREAAEATKIRGEYLQQLESNKFDLDLSELYVRGFLKAYARYLGLPADKILADYLALNRGGERSRAINPEVYGRMELPKPAAPKAGDDPRPEPAAALSTAPGKSVPGRSLPPRPSAAFPPRHLPGSGPTADQTILLKLIGLIVGGVLFIVIVIWGVSLLFTGSKTAVVDKSAAIATPAPSAAVPSSGTVPLMIYALGPVNVTIQQKSDSKVLFEGPLTAGAVKEVPRSDDLRVTAVPWQNVQFELVRGGSRYQMPDGNVHEVPLSLK